MENNKRLNDIIIKRKIIDLEVFEGSMFQDCICLFCNIDIWIVANFDRVLNKCDGISVFKNKDVDQYSVYKKKYLSRSIILVDAEIEYEWLQHVEEFEEILSSLLHSKEVVSFFTNVEDYYVGIINSINQDSITFQIISVDFELMEEKTIEIEKILYISFGTEYEKKIQKKIGNISDVLK